jgi:asparaginyl-tRNA synthetase
VGILPLPEEGKMNFEKIALAENKERVKIFKTKEMQAIIKIESAVLKGIRNYFEKEGFVEIVVPHITKASGSCENILTLFELNYFGKRAYLSQTGQLFLEVMSPIFKKVWCSIHSFRAEEEVDNRHLTEFTLIEIEFLGNLEKLMEYTEEAIYSAAKEVSKLEEELEILGINKERLRIFRPPYKRIKYSEAIEILKEFNLKIGDDLKSIHEKKLAEIFGPVFITHYPKEIKFFNMRENEENPEIVNSVDLILPLSGEAVGGAEREFRYEKLIERLRNSKMLKLLKEKGGSEEDFDWYLEFWKEHEGTLHSGCGIGVNRVVQSIIGSNDIRATTPFVMNKNNLF